VTDLVGLLAPYVDDGSIPGAVAIVARGDDLEVAVVGDQDLRTGEPMRRESIFRIASITKPITAAAVLLLVDQGVLGLDDPVARWLPEISSPSVVRTPASPIDDVVPAHREITVLDLLTNRAGWGFPSNFELPQVQALFTVQTDGREIQLRPDPDEWLARLASIPLLYQPGQAWLYDTCSDLQGILIARAARQSLPQFLAERVFAPLGMTDTSFVVPFAKRDRFTSYYRPGPDGTLELDDAPDGRWSTMPAFPAGAGGLAGTADDWYRFARMLLEDGTVDGRPFLSTRSRQLMMTNQLTAAAREVGELFLEGQGWGFGGAVDLDDRQPWSVPGRYGWVGGTGTSAHVISASDTVAILLTQRGAVAPVAEAFQRDFWTYAARRSDG
jgi:CubicO group peptidase (beta-lactamase class C family)